MVHHRLVQTKVIVNLYLLPRDFKPRVANRVFRHLRRLPATFYGSARLSTAVNALPASALKNNNPVAAVSAKLLSQDMAN